MGISGLSWALSCAACCGHRPDGTPALPDPTSRLILVVPGLCPSERMHLSRVSFWGTPLTRCSASRQGEVSLVGTEGQAGPPGGLSWAGACDRDSGAASILGGRKLPTSHTWNTCKAHQGACEGQEWADLARGRRCRELSMCCATPGQRSRAPGRGGPDPATHWDPNQVVGASASLVGSPNRARSSLVGDNLGALGAQVLSEGNLPDAPLGSLL